MNPNRAILGFIEAVRIALICLEKAITWHFKCISQTIVYYLISPNQTSPTFTL